MQDKALLQIMELNGIRLSPTVAKNLCRSAQSLATYGQHVTAGGIMVNFKEALRSIHIDADASTTDPGKGLDGLSWVIRDSGKNARDRTSPSPLGVTRLGSFYPTQDDRARTPLLERKRDGSQPRQFTLDRIADIDAEARKELDGQRTLANTAHAPFRRNSIDFTRPGPEPAEDYDPVTVGADKGTAEDDIAVQESDYHAEGTVVESARGPMRLTDMALGEIRRASLDVDALSRGAVPAADLISQRTLSRNGTAARRDAMSRTVASLRANKHASATSIPMPHRASISPKPERRASQMRDYNDDAGSQISAALESIRHSRGKVLEKPSFIKQNPFIQERPSKYPEPKSPFKRGDPLPATLKAGGNAAVADAMEKFASYKQDLFNGMQAEYLGPGKGGPHHTGKRIFTEHGNKSASTNMYPATEDHDERRQLFHRRHTADYWNKAGVQYIPPPVTKAFAKRHSWVHNTLENKSKTNPQFLEHLRSPDVLTPSRRKVLLALRAHGIDSRMLLQFKNALYDSETLTESQYVPLATWQAVGHYEMNRLLDGELNGVVLAEVYDKATDRVDLGKLGELVDLYFYLPTKSKPGARNES